eukprot:COSAG02_NODE_1620_length_11617_cov_3.185275_9_plen_458_part_00
MFAMEFLCALLAVKDHCCLVQAWKAFGLFGGADQAARYARYASEPQALLTVPLEAISRADVHSADGARADVHIAYSGFSHLICPGLLAVVVVPSAAHCRALCVGNGPPCWVFTFTPAGRCYLGARYNAGGRDHVFRGWYAEDVPGAVSGMVVGRTEGYAESPSASQQLRPRVPTDLCDKHETLIPIPKLGVAEFAASLETADSYVLTYSSRSHEGRLFQEARAKLEHAVAGSSQLRPQRLLLSVGIDCCMRSKVLNALTGLAFAGFDAVVQPSREHYGKQFADTYHDLLHETRGAGYWAWKPYFLLRTLLELAQDDDLVFYGDAGTYFKADSLAHREAEWNFLYNHSRTAQGFRQDVLVYAEGSPEWQRTKRDLVNAALLGLGDSYGRNDSRRDATTSASGGSGASDRGHDGGTEGTSKREQILQSSQLSATWVVVRRSPQSIAFVNDWLSACLGVC